MGEFYSLLSKSRLFNPEMAIGYSDSEIESIEQLYEIKIGGMLYDYLSTMGRCDGGARAGEVEFSIHMSLTPAHYLSDSLELERDMSIAGLDHYLRQKPFLFSTENLGSYSYFLLTDSDVTDQIYCYNEDEKVVYGCGMTLFDYVKFWAFEHDDIDLCTNHALARDSRMYWVGEIIDFDRTGKRPVPPHLKNN